MMNYQQYRDSVIGKRVCRERYGYQCVWVFKDFVRKVYNWKIGRTWNANQIWYNSYHIFGNDRFRTRDMTNVQPWDVIISVRRWYWHIALVNSDQWDYVEVLEQNGIGGGNGLWANRVRLKRYAKKFFVWVWRKL